MRDAPLPDLVLYGRPGCGLCDETRTILDRAPRRASARRPGRPDPRRARHRDRPGLGARLLQRRSRSSSSATAGSSWRPARRSSAASWPTSWTPDRPMAGTDLTILVALAAGVISFLSPCVLPLVPAYLGQLTAIAVAGSAAGATPSRWLAVRHALAYVAGFGAVFTVLGITATFAAGPLVDYLPALRDDRRHHPHRARARPGGPAPHPASSSGRGDRSTPAPPDRWRPRRARPPSAAAAAGPSVGDRIGGHVVSSRGGWLASFGLGAIFAIGWSPCIGIILGGILTLAATSGTVAQGAILLIAYTIGLGLPFLLIAAVFDRAPRVMAPLVRHGRTVSLIGGLLVVAIGVAMVFDWLGDPAALLQLQHGDLSDRPTRVQPQAANATASIGPFSGRQLVIAFAAVLVAVDRARRRHDAARQHRDRARHGRPTRDRLHHLVAAADRAQGRRDGARVRGHQRRRHDLPADRSRRQADPPGRPARQGRLGQLLDDLVPALPVRGADPARRVRARTRTAASCSSRSASRRRRPPTWPPTRRATSSRYTIGFDGSGKIFHAYKAYGLPTQVFIDPNGVIASIVGAPLDEAGAAAHIEPILPPAASPSP